ncbi:MAG: hypothetical protein ACRCWO_01180 [Bosea sp. (in: a-proteobacteria)]
MMAIVPIAATAQEAFPREAVKGWAHEKCARYTRAYEDSVARLGINGLGQEFLSRHNAFLAAGCISSANVCPESEEELRLANALVIRGMNAGMPSTFFPFSCRKGAAAQALSKDPRHNP